MTERPTDETLAQPLPTILRPPSSAPPPMDRPVVTLPGEGQRVFGPFTLPPQSSQSASRTATPTGRARCMGRLQQAAQAAPAWPAW